MNWRSWRIHRLNGSGFHIGLSGDLAISAALLAALSAAACSGGTQTDLPPAPVDSVSAPQVRQRAPQPGPAARDPVLPPRVAMLAGLLPTKSIGVDTFRMLHPQFDGRGVLIGILDSGIDPGVPGLRTTTTDRPKIIELRDFSGEGRIALEATYQVGDSLHVGQRLLTGLGRVGRLASPPYYVGVFRERALGAVPMADVNGDGDNTDTFGVVVAKASNGWFVVTDADGDGSLEDEEPIRDYGIAREIFSFRASSNDDLRGPMTFAVNLREENSAPWLDFFFDNSSHGTHVAGIAAGHQMFGVEGFDGIAPGAQLLGLKISDNARGSISVTGSMLRAMNHAADFARRRNLPLVLNLSFGIGNEQEGQAAIDSLVNEFTLKNPDVLFVIAAGNDGPGLSTIRFPGSAEYAMSVCALFPGVFVEPPSPRKDPPADVVAWWSARGGEVAKPDLCAPGVAYSNVPLWRTGEEISPGTSQAAPQIAGAAALLQSALLDRGRRARAIDLIRALTSTASRPSGTSILDVGAGIPNVEAAFRWLLAAHQTGVYEVRSLADGGNTSAGPAAYRRSGLARSDTLQRFAVRSLSGQPSARFRLYSDAPWLAAPREAEPRGRPFTIPVRYDRSQLTRPGVYVGTVWARSATDSMAGPSFGLVNTIVVPYSLEQPMSVRDVVEAGAVKRYFLEVPERSGGMTVNLSVPSARDLATLHLFEPGGQPQRETSSVTLGGANERSATIRVRGEDLVPGVYEAVVVAQPNSRASFELEAALPAVTVQSVQGGPSITVQNPTDRTVSASVTAMLIGAVRTERLTGTGAERQVITVNPPPGSRELVLEVALDPSYWQQVTDFGVTLFDSADTKLGDHPLIYSFGRQRIRLDSLGYAGPLTIELLPAYAHLDPPDTWTVDVTIAFLREDFIPLISSDSTDRIRLPIRAGGSETVEFLPLPDSVIIPVGYWPFVEATARTPFGPAVVRRGAAVPR